MSAERQRVHPVWPALVAVVAVVLYANTLSNRFALDDIPLVRDNPNIRSLSGVPALFVSPYWPDEEGSAAGLYRPVTLASFSVNRTLTGPDAWGFHLGNVLLHGLAATLAWFALRRTSVVYGTAILGGLLFAVHPIHSEAVANIAGRAELLAAAGVLAAWIAHRRVGEAKSPRAVLGWGIASGIFYLLALLSKESAIAAPILFLLDDHLRRQHSGSTSGRVASAMRFLPHAVALTIALSLRFVALGGLRGAEDVFFLDNPAAFAGRVELLATAVWVQVRYVWLLLWPATLCSDYSYDAIPVVSSLFDLRAAAGLCLILGLVALLVYGWKRCLPIAIGTAVWLLFFLPSSNLLFASGTIMAERLAYLPSLGACLVAGHVGARLASRIRTGNRERFGVGVVVIAAGLILGALAARTWTRNPVWRDNGSLALHDVNVMPRSAKLQAGAAIVLDERGDRDGAERHYRQALELYPDYAQMHHNLGALLARKGDESGAIDHLLRAMDLAPGNPLPAKKVARLLERAGRTEEALRAYEHGATTDPGDLAFRFSWGRALMAAGRAGQGRTVLQQLAADAPDQLPGRLAGGLVAEIDGRTGEAAQVYRELVGHPDLPSGIRSRLERWLAEAGRPVSPKDASP
jgi:Flp pilus assembly protein TadD